jgi:multisubunit Na+/H+ antiporter MnhF subunit
MFSDPPRRLLAIIASGLSILFVASLVFSEELPQRVLGMNKLLCQAFLILGALAASWGGRILDYFRGRK